MLSFSGLEGKRNKWSRLHTLLHLGSGEGGGTSQEKTQWLGESQNRDTHLRKGMPLGEALPAAGLKSHMVLLGAGQQRPGKLPGGCSQAHLSSSRQRLDTQVLQWQVGVPREPGGLGSHKLQQQVAGLPSTALGIKPDLALPVDFSTGAHEAAEGTWHTLVQISMDPASPRSTQGSLQNTGASQAPDYKRRRDTGRHLKRELEL